MDPLTILVAFAAAILWGSQLGKASVRWATCHNRLIAAALNEHDEAT